MRIDDSYNRKFMSNVRLVHIYNSVVFDSFIHGACAMGVHDSFIYMSELIRMCSMNCRSADMTLSCASFCAPPPFDPGLSFNLFLPVLGLETLLPEKRTNFTHNTRAGMYVCEVVYMCVCMFLRMSVCMCVPMYIHMHVVSTYTCMYVQSTENKLVFIRQGKGVAKVVTVKTVKQEVVVEIKEEEETGAVKGRATAKRKV